jgi:uncharacterized protein YdhG (YjbR/CyaY superfamily)
MFSRREHQPPKLGVVGSNPTAPATALPGRDSMAPKKAFETIDEYIATFPPNVQTILQQLRQVIKDAAPGAEEAISYRMPAFKLNGVLVWFAAFKSHIGFFPKTSVIEAFKGELSGYELSKGTIRFPLDKPIPFDLVKRMVEFRVRENLAKK